MERSALLLHKLEACPQTSHSRRHSFAISKYGSARHQDVCPCGNRERGRVGIDSSVHLQIAVVLETIDHSAHNADLCQRCLEKLLMSEPRVDGHDQHLVNLGE